jgi:hypothetical protein
MGRRCLPPRVARSIRDLGYPEPLGSYIAERDRFEPDTEFRIAPAHIGFFHQTEKDVCCFVSGSTSIAQNIAVNRPDKSSCDSRPGS